MSNPKNFWFKRRRYGWGFIPVTWQGWLTVMIFIILAVGGALTLVPAAGQTSAELAFYLLFLALLIIAMIRVALAKGPKPHWRWGRRPTDDPEEDF